jgi:hypothetical protein
VATQMKVMARLLSVNVSLPRDIEWQGKTVHTAVWKVLRHFRVIARRIKNADLAEKRKSWRARSGGALGDKHKSCSESPAARLRPFRASPTCRS